MSRVPEKSWKIVKVSWVAGSRGGSPIVCLSHHSPRVFVLKWAHACCAKGGVRCLVSLSMH